MDSRRRRRETGSACTLRILGRDLGVQYQPGGEAESRVFSASVGTSRDEAREATHTSARLHHGDVVTGYS